MNEDDKVMARVRYQLAAVLELIGSAEMQREYQSKAPVNVADELFNQWDDWSGDRAHELGPPFSPEEVRAVAAFNDVLSSVAGRTPQSMPPLVEFQATPEWAELSDAAREALKAFPPLDKSWLPEEDRP